MTSARVSFNYAALIALEGVVVSTSTEESCSSPSKQPRRRTFKGTPLVRAKYKKHPGNWKASSHRTSRQDATHSANSDDVRITSSAVSLSARALQLSNIAWKTFLATGYLNHTPTSRTRLLKEEASADGHTKARKSAEHLHTEDEGKVCAPAVTEGAPNNRPCGEGHSSRIPARAAGEQKVSSADNVHAAPSRDDDLDHDSDDGENTPPAKRPLKRGRDDERADENEIPCTCYMTGLREYQRCTKKHKYLSHLARHLYSHDVYICQLCFATFAGHGKEENFRRKQNHRCVKACSDGSCRRHRLEHEASPLFCRHLNTWEGQWHEMSRTQYPNMPTPDPHSAPSEFSVLPASRRPQRLPGKSHERFVEGTEQHQSHYRLELYPGHYMAQENYSSSGEQDHYMRPLSQVSTVDSYAMERPATSTTNGYATSEASTQPTEYLGPEFVDMRGNAMDLAEDDFLGNTGIGTMELDDGITLNGGVLLTADHTTSHLQEVQIQGLSLRIGELEASLSQHLDAAQVRKQRIERLETDSNTKQQKIATLEAALARSIDREKERQLELTSVQNKMAALQRQMAELHLQLIQK